MGKKLYVGNLGFSVTDSELHELFLPYGVVNSAQVINDRDTGRSKGFGFVDELTEEAEAAISGTNGSQLGGRSITVNEARPKDNSIGARSRPSYGR